jgi:hypothetical protein
MTELEMMQRAKMYMDNLAQGIDPISNQELPEDTVLNNVRLARCFFYVSGLLGKVIDNGGVIGGKPQLQPFSVSPEQLARITPSPEPVRITQLIEMISAVADGSQMKKLNTTVITNWLLEKGFLEKTVGPDGKSRRLPTQLGIQIGLSTQTRQGQYGDYQAVFYDMGAQQFVLDNLESMLESK